MRLLTPSQDRTSLRFLDSRQALLSDTVCTGFIVRASTGRRLGVLQGFAVDVITSELKFLVIRTPGLLGRNKLLSFAAVRVDAPERVVQVITDQAAVHQMAELLPMPMEDHLVAEGR
jgi:hypothetical protein